MTILYDLVDELASQYNDVRSRLRRAKDPLGLGDLSQPEQYGPPERLASPVGLEQYGLRALGGGLPLGPVVTQRQRAAQLLEEDVASGRYQGSLADLAAQRRGFVANELARQGIDVGQDFVYPRIDDSPGAALRDVVGDLRAADAAIGRELFSPLTGATPANPIGSRGTLLGGDRRSGWVNLLRSLGEESLRPTSLAALAAPPVRGGTLASTALKNAALQGGLNVGQDLLLGRTDPEELALSGGLGALLGGVTAPGVATGAVRTLRDIAGDVQESGLGRALASERGALLPEAFARRAQESRDAIFSINEQLREKGIPIETRDGLKFDRMVQSERVRLLESLRQWTNVEQGEHVVIQALEDTMSAIDDELGRRNIPFGGRAGMSRAAFRRSVRRGANATGALGGFAKGTVDELMARRQAVESLLDDLIPDIVPDTEIRPARIDVFPGATDEPAAGAAENRLLELLTPEERARTQRGLARFEPERGFGEEQRPPTATQVEQLSRPAPPEERAALPREMDQAFYRPADFAEATDETLSARGGAFEALQGVAQRIPVVRSFFQFAEPIAAARAQSRLGNVIPEVMVRRELFIDGEKAQARAGLFDWLARHGGALGLNQRTGVARNVEVREGALIPDRVRGRLDDVVEHPEDYVLTPEQEQAITEIRHTLDATTQAEQAAGVDVREVEGGYFPRVVTKAPKEAQPKGGGVGSQLTKRPTHAKAREFDDVRSGVEAGYEYGSPIEALQNRLDEGIAALANKRTQQGIRELGEKPSERVPQRVRDAVNRARDAYRENPTAENAAVLDKARRELRVAAGKAREPRIGESVGFGRIFPASVMDELAKYTQIDNPTLFEEFFRVQRASATTGDWSSLFVQNGNLFYRNNVAWWKALGYGMASMFRTPTRYVSNNIDVIQRGIEARAIVPPTEYQLSKGGGISRGFGRLPGVKQVQQFFEWNIFVGQTEWWKAAERMAKNPREAQEMASVIRKATGSMLRPGLTRRQRQAEVLTFFAGRFLMAVNGTAADALRGGVRGMEARKTIGMLIAGATAFTIAGQLATDGSMPNLTDPNDRRKPWLSIKRPGGTVNLFGPLFPYIRAYAQITQDLERGEYKSAGDSALFLGRSRLSLPFSSLIDLIMGEDVVGESVRGPKELLKAQAMRFVPLSARDLRKGGAQGVRDFPEGLSQGAGLRANRASDFARTLNAGQSYIDKAGGDFEKAWRAAQDAGDTRAADGVKISWRDDFEQRAPANGIVVIKGSQDPPRAPRIEFSEWDQRWGEWGPYIANQLQLPEARSLSELRAAFVDASLPWYLQNHAVGEKQAKQDLGTMFDAYDFVKEYAKQRAQFRLDFWKLHPDLLNEAQYLGLETLNKDERKILENAAPATPAAR